jgi:hypothetical protein
LRKALARITSRPLRIRIAIGDAGEAAAPISPRSSSEPNDDVTARALNNPEVRRFREVFGGEVRKVRNLKES